MKVSQIGKYCLCNSAFRVLHIICEDAFKLTVLSTLMLFFRNAHAALDELLAWQPAEFNSREASETPNAPKKMVPKKNGRDTLHHSNHHTS